MDYIVVITGSQLPYSLAYDLQRRVNARIADGYKPVGGMSVIERDGDLYFAQAMIKEE